MSEQNEMESKYVEMIREKIDNDNDTSGDGDREEISEAGRSESNIRFKDHNALSYDVDSEGNDIVIDFVVNTDPENSEKDIRRDITDILYSLNEKMVRFYEDVSVDVEYNDVSSRSSGERERVCEIIVTYKFNQEELEWDLAEKLGNILGV